MIVIDEAAHTSRDLFYRVILPVHYVRRTALVAISSPVDADNWFSRLMNMKDANGEPLIFSSSVQVVCKACRKLEPKEMIKCRHVKEANPRHKDKTKRSRFDQAYDEEGLTDQNLQENYGESTTPRNCAFQGDWLEYAFDHTKSKRVPVRKEDIQVRIKEIIVCIDPNGGGLNQTAIVIGYFNEGSRNVVVSVIIFFFIHFF
ncbi:MAG: hypothetical protein ACTSUE_15825 [Promethearchaeota archaeon]